MAIDVKPYKRGVYYYETDQMAIVHHSNYIRWFEEARIDYMSQVGVQYDEMEKMGLLIPVLGVSCEYKQAIKYGEQVEVICTMESLNAVKFSVSYEIRNIEDGRLHATGTSKHCFVNKELKPISLKKAAPIWYQALEAQVRKEGC